VVRINGASTPARPLGKWYESPFKRERRWLISKKDESVRGEYRLTREKRWIGANRGKVSLKNVFRPRKRRRDLKGSTVRGSLALGIMEERSELAHSTLQRNCGGGDLNPGD